MPHFGSSPGSDSHARIPHSWTITAELWKMRMSAGRREAFLEIRTIQKIVPILV